MAYKFEVYKDKQDEFRFRFKAPNGENMFASQGYKQKSFSTAMIHWLMRYKKTVFGLF